MSLLDKFVVKTLPLVPKPVVRFFSKKYIAGEELKDAVRVVRELNKKNFMATMDVLGESVTDRNLAGEMLEESKTVLTTIGNEKLDSNLSIKLTQMGLDVDYDFVLNNVRDIVSHAGTLGNFLRIDMEDSTTTDRTLDIYRKMRWEFKNVGVAVQSYLHRTESDVRDLVREKSNFRVCKGIYVEPAEIAYKNREDINKSFLRIVEIAALPLDGPGLRQPGDVRQLLRLRLDGAGLRPPEVAARVHRPAARRPLHRLQHRRGHGAPARRLPDRPLGHAQVDHAVRADLPGRRVPDRGLVGVPGHAQRPLLPGHGRRAAHRGGDHGARQVVQGQGAELRLRPEPDDLAAGLGLGRLVDRLGAPPLRELAGPAVAGDRDRRRVGRRCHALLVHGEPRRRRVQLGETGETEKIERKGLYSFSPSYWYIVALCVVFYSTVFPFRAFAIYYFQQAHGLEREAAGMLSSLLPIAAMIATPLFGLLVDRVGKRSFFMAVGSMILLPLFLIVTYAPPGGPSGDPVRMDSKRSLLKRD
jgi:hypothetical protein